MKNNILEIIAENFSLHEFMLFSLNMAPHVVLGASYFMTQHALDWSRRENFTVVGGGRRKDTGKGGRANGSKGTCPLTLSSVDKAFCRLFSSLAPWLTFVGQSCHH